MFINFSPSDVKIQVDFNETVRLATKHGFAGTNLNLAEIARLPDPESAAMKVKDAGLQWGAFGLSIEFRKDQASYDKDLAGLQKLLPVAKRIGAQLAFTCIVPGHNELDYEANYQQHVERLAPVAQMLADHDIRLALEFIGPKTLRDTFRHGFIHTADKMLEFAGDITPTGAANVGLLVDSYHVYTSAATEEYLDTHLTHDNVFYVHVNDARPNRSRDEQMDLERLLPCESGIIDSAAFVRILRRINYEGPVTAEPFDDTLAGGDPDEVTQRVYQSISKMLSLA